MSVYRGDYLDQVARDPGGKEAASLGVAAARAYLERDSGGSRFKLSGWTSKRRAGLAGVVLVGLLSGSACSDGTDAVAPSTTTTSPADFLKGPHGCSWIVKQGDSLWKISGAMNPDGRRIQDDIWSALRARRSLEGREQALPLGMQIPFPIQICDQLVGDPDVQDRVVWFNITPGYEPAHEKEGGPSLGGYEHDIESS